jgi:hypothetical protein
VNARFAAALALLPFICQCDPSLSLDGWVHRADDSPVSGATVRTRCTDEGTYGEASATTKADGTFSAEGTGSVNEDCVIEVLVTGEPTRKFDALDYCTDGNDVSCTTLEAHLAIPPPVDE